jgi:predicted secreted hydrolase
MKNLYLKSLSILLSIVLCFNLKAQDPFEYPYSPEGAKVKFPYDDGKHNTSTTYSEWWYLNLHLVGSAPEYKKYDVMVAYFRKPAMIRIFNISRPDSKIFHTDVDVEPGWFTQAVGEWNLAYKPNKYNDYSYSTYSQDHRPYSYNFHATSLKNNDILDVNVEGLRPPLLVGGTGFLAEGLLGDKSYYFSYTNMKVNGKITFDGIEDSITSGIGWIDRQYGPFRIGFSPKMGYEWYGLQLDNPGVEWGKPEQPTEINMAQIFNLNTLAQSPKTKLYSAIYSDNSQDTSSTYILERTGYWKNSLSKFYYSQGWRLINPTKGINVYIEPDIKDQLIDMLVFKFWEGSVTARGTVGEQNVDGLGFVELVTSFKNEIISPSIPENLNIIKANNINTINWSSSTPGTLSIGGYRVYRSTSNLGYWKYLGSTTETSFNDSPPSQTEQYFYTVSSYDAGSIITASLYAPGVSTLSGKNIDNSKKMVENPLVIKLYPNPTSDYLNVITDLKQPFIANIFDETGKLVSSKELNQNSYQINLAGISAGVYTIQILSSSKIESRTFVINR